MARTAANLQMTVGGIAVMVLVAGAAWFGLGPEPEAPASPAPPVEVEALALVGVHVSGAVTQPGVVMVSADSRIADALAAAGGVTVDANLSGINLAATIRDGDLIIVPRIGGAQATQAQTGTVGIDLNRSSASQLEQLPGVGPVLAERIVAYRDANGLFDEVEDLLDVPGIGEAKLAGMRDDIASP